jgi:hypothetical protein
MTCPFLTYPFANQDLLVDAGRRVGPHEFADCINVNPSSGRAEALLDFRHFAIAVMTI